jgi:hypothetical protein
MSSMTAVVDDRGLCTLWKMEKRLVHVCVADNARLLTPIQHVGGYKGILTELLACVFLNNHLHTMAAENEEALITWSATHNKPLQRLEYVVPCCESAVRPICLMVCRIV